MCHLGIDECKKYMYVYPLIDHLNKMVRCVYRFHLSSFSHSLLLFPFQQAFPPISYKHWEKYFPPISLPPPPPHLLLQKEEEGTRRKFSNVTISLYLIHQENYLVSSQLSRCGVYSTKFAISIIIHYYSLSSSHLSPVLYKFVEEAWKALKMCVVRLDRVEKIRQKKLFLLVWMYIFFGG